jgi:hypothetical protein
LGELSQPFKLERHIFIVECSSWNILHCESNHPRFHVFEDNAIKWYDIWL